MFVEALLLFVAGISSPAFLAPPHKELHSIFSSARSEGSANALVDMKVEPGGRVYECTLVASVGDESLLKRLCPTLQRKKTTGATNSAGQPSYGLLRTYVSLQSWGDPNAPPPQTAAPDYELVVNTLPASAENGLLEIHFDCEVSLEGVVVRCDLASKPDNAPPPANYFDVAERQVVGSTLPPMTNRDGQPVPYVREVTVAFTLAGSS